MDNDLCPKSSLFWSDCHHGPAIQRPSPRRKEGLEREIDE
jgi:hypothetical protein